MRSTQSRFSRIFLSLALAFAMLLSMACLTPTVAETGYAADSSMLRGWDGESYQYIMLGEYTQNSKAKTPIIWRVLYAEHDRALLLSESIIDAGRFDYKTNDWDASIIKTWLNNDFVYEAFSRAEMDLIITNDDIGQVFLLSSSEYLLEAYGFAKNSKAKDPNRIALGTTYARDLGLQIVANSQGQGAYYTRTRSGSQNVIIYRGDGSIATCMPDRTNVGYRPAIYIDTSTLALDQSTGSFDDPFRIKY